MRDRDVDLAILLVRKDALLADHQLSLALWHAVQGAGLAVPGFVLVGFLQGAVASVAAMGALGIALGMVILGDRGATRKRATFKRQLQEILAGMERLKTGVEP